MTSLVFRFISCDIRGLEVLIMLHHWSSGSYHVTSEVLRFISYDISGLEVHII